MIPKFWADLLSKQPTPAKPKLPVRSGMKSISEESDIRRGRLSQSSRLQHRSGESNKEHGNNNIPTMQYGTGIPNICSFIHSICPSCHWMTMPGNSRLMHCGITFNVPYPHFSLQLITALHICVYFLWLYHDARNLMKFDWYSRHN